MITVNKANPTPGEITSSLTGSTGDGSGLHFDGSAGNISFTPVDLGSKFSHEFVIKADEDLTTGSSSYIIDYEGGSGRFVIGAEPTQASGNLAIYDDAGWKSFGVNPLTDLKVHHIVVTVDGTAAVLYDNGNQVGTATINANHGIDNATAATIGSNFFTATSNNFEGTIYRARSYNRTLSADDVRTAFERADVPFADQYGTQTAILESDFSSGTSGFTGAGLTVAGNIDSIGGQNDTLRSTIDSSTGNHQTIRGISGTNGRRYRATGKVYIPSANALVDKVIVNNQGDLTNVIATITATDTWTDFEAEFIREYPEIRFRAYDGTANSFAGNGSDVFYIKDIKIVPSGCVSDYDLAFANPKNSFKINDRSGAADGTASNDGTNPTGISQVQVIKQLNATSARIGTTAATPADGEIIATGVKAETYRSARSDGDVYIQAATASDFVAIGTQVSSTLLKVDGSGQALFSGSKVTVNTDGTIDWGNAADAGRLTWDTNDAKIRGVAGKNLKLGADNTDYVTIDTSGHIILPNAGQTIKTDLSSGSTTRTGIIELYNGSTGALSLKTDNQATGGIELWTEGTKRLDVQRDGVCAFSNGITVSGDTKLGNGLVSNYVQHVAGLDDTVAISFTFPSQSSRWIHQLLELRVAMGDDAATAATPTFLRYAFATLTTATGITQMDASLGNGITVATSASGTTLTVTLTEGSAIAMDSVTVFATVTTGHGDAKCTGMTVA